MSQIIIPEELKSEFKIDSDGKAYASFRAVARLTGTSESGSGIAMLLKRVALTESKSKWLEPLLGMDYSALTVSGKGIPDTVVSLLVQHFAFSGNEVAQQTLGAFTAVGLRAWIHSELKWQSNQPQTYLEALEQLVEKEKIRQKIAASYEGLLETYDSCGENDVLPPCGLGNKFELKEWLLFKNIVLSRSEKISLGNFLASTVERDTKKRTIRRGRNVMYTHEHLPLLDEGYKTWLRERREFI